MHDVAYIALGSNLGDRDQNLATARDRIAQLEGVTFLRASCIEETEALGPVQPCYLNQMIAVRTTLTPRQLLDRLHEIEQAGGRERSTRWGPRTIDLDIVTYAHTTWNTPDLKVPHVELPHRDFWLHELAEIFESSE